MTTFDRPANEQIEWFARAFSAVQENIEQVIKGKSAVVKRALVCFFAEGHLLIEDVQGVGKTSMARALAASIDASWHRIQFTPDLLPSDITGVSVFNQATRDFEFKPGSVFANIVVADEINRASPKSQSALLEVMEEQNVTVDAVPHTVPSPFFVVATQNPIDMDGTYPLPEAQLDRFLMRIQVGYPSHDAELAVVRNNQEGSGTAQLRPIISIDNVRTMAEIANTAFVSPALQSYAVQLAASTRQMPELRLGVSPRGTLGLVRASRVLAAAEGRSYVAPEDLQSLAAPVFCHRMLRTPEAELQGRTTEQLVQQVLATVPVPLVLDEA
jgi:MoxR-like ATPase